MYSHCCASSLQNSHPLGTETLYPINNYPHSPLLPLATTALLSVSMSSATPVPHINGDIGLFECLTYFTVCPQGSPMLYHVSRLFFLFKGWIIFHSVDVTRFCFFSHLWIQWGCRFLRSGWGFSIFLHSLFHHLLQRTQILEIRTTKRKSHAPWNEYEGCPLTRHTCLCPLYE